MAERSPLAIFGVILMPLSSKNSRRVWQRALMSVLTAIYAYWLSSLTLTDFVSTLSTTSSSSGSNSSSKSSSICLTSTRSTVLNSSRVASSSIFSCSVLSLLSLMPAIIRSNAPRPIPIPLSIARALICSIRGRLIINRHTPYTTSPMKVVARVSAPIAFALD